MDNITEHDLFVDGLSPEDLMQYLHDIGHNDPSSDGHSDDDASSDMPALVIISRSANENIQPDPSSQSQTSSRDHAFSAPEAQALSTPEDDEEEDQMPDLQSISSDSSDEVEMMQNLQPIDDDNDSAWTDSGTNPSDLDMPPLEPIQPHESSTRNNRRARVDDDEDQDRDRRHPSQRVAGTTNSNNVNQRPPSLPPLVPHVPFQIRIPAIVRIVSAPRSGVPNPTPNPLRRPQDGTPPNPGAAQHQHHHHHPHPNTNIPRPHPHAVPIFTGGFTVTLGAGGPNTRPGPGNRNPPPGPGIPRPFGNVPPLGGGDFNGDNFDLNMFADFIGRFGAGLGQALGLDREEPEDPERAKRLVDGLEEVPVGLVRRLEQVGGAPGGHVDEASTETPGCAICWDKLLDAEGDGFAREEDKPATSTDGEQTTTAPASSDVSSTTSQSEGASTSTTPTSSATSKYPKITSLPCAHVFHASCLIPWFSRPNQTTCPTCRFNIDPENLTYVRRPPPPPQANPQPVPQDPPTTNPIDTPVAPQGSPEQQENATATDASVPPATPIPDGVAPQVPAATAPTDAANVAATPPAPGPIPNPNSRNPSPDMWTFGFDLILEQAHAQPPAGAQGPVPGATAAEGQADHDMDIDEEIDMNEAGDMRREVETFAQQLFGGMGFNMADVVVPDNANPMPPTAGDAGTPPLPPTGPQGNALPGGGFPRAFQPTFVPLPAFQWPPGNPFGPPPAGAPPGDPAGNRPFNAWRGFPPPFATGTIIRNNALFALLISDTARHPGQPGGAPAGFPRPPRERKAWSLPPAPGPTLRQRVEQKEREAGLRCFDTSCGVGPSDEEPCMGLSAAGMKQLRIRPFKRDAETEESMCGHTFHPACLVSAERVAMMFKGESVAGGEVEVSCPMCRAVGCITTEEWREGELALA